MKKKILYVTFEPLRVSSSASIRNHEMIKALMACDYIVDVITIVPNERQKFETNLLNVNGEITELGGEDKKNETFKNINKIKNEKILNELKKVVRKLTIHNFSLKYLKYINKKISVLDNYYHYVISSSDPKTSHSAVLKLIKEGLKYDKWIQYWGDPLVNDITNDKLIPKKILMKIEKRYIKKADKIVYVSPVTLQLQQRMFKDFEYKMEFVPNIINDDEKLYKNKTDNSFIVGYYGGYNSNVRNIYPLIQACHNLNDVTLRIIGYSDLNLVSQDNILIYENLHKSEIKEKEKNTDLIICILNKKGTQIPGKVYHYMNSNIPVLVILDGEYKNDIRSYLEKFKRFVFIDNKPEDIKEVIERIKKENIEVGHYNFPTAYEIINLMLR